MIKSNFFLRHKKIIIFSTIGVLLVTCIIFSFGFKGGNKVVANTVSQTAIVTKGDINVKVSGSSSISSSNSKTITSEVSSTVTGVNVSVGDRVSKGDVLIELDATSLSASVKSDQKSVTNLQKQVNDLKEDIKNLNVISSYNGYVENMNCKIGDTVTKNSQLFSLKDTSTYIVDCSFYYNSSYVIKVGDTATLFLPDTFLTLNGTVSYVSDAKELTTGNAQVQSVEITVNNPGFSLDGISALATVITDTNSIQSISESEFQIGNEITFKCPSSGTIKQLYIRNGSYVKSGSLVMVLENDDLSDDLSDAQSSLSIAYENLTDTRSDSSLYTITAPFDGLVTEVFVLPGDEVRNETSLVRIVDNYNVEFDIEVDELDISKIEIGQDVNITIDAITETATTPIVGKVTKIAVEGTSMNDVTSYPVTISFTGNDDIKIGMNASAEIIVESSNNTLILPVEAITSRRNKHYVTLEDGTSKEVEIGLYNEDYIEIKSGIEEGEKVSLPQTITNTTTTKTVTQGANGFMNMTGGMPTGGTIPTGGMPTGNTSQRRQQ